MARGHFAVRVKEELAALRPGAPSERRALLAGLLRFAATLHLAGTVGPRVTLVLATESGGVARLAFWLLHAAYGVRPEFRMRTRGALVARVRYEVVLAERVERVLGGAGILDGSGQLATGVPARLVRGRAAAACYARGAFLGRGSVTAPTRAPHLEIGMPDEHSARDLAALLARLDLPAAAGVRAVSRPWPAPPRTRRWPAGRRRAGDRHPGRIRADQGRIAHRFPGPSGAGSGVGLW